MKSKPILFYHNIGHENYKSFSTVDEFDYQMNDLSSNGIKNIDCNNLDAETGGFCITFDDGYEDNLIYALPILKKYNLTATCFIVPKLIGKTNVWDQHQFKLMDIYQIKEWIDEGMSIGSHSFSHQNLTKIKNNELKTEIDGSKKYLEDKFQLHINNFCYPYGKYNQIVINEVKKSKYKKAFTTNRGLYNSTKSNNFELNRVSVSRGISNFKFWLKTRTFYENL
jgi:peptidoglycan/xylan/chitin deacetylase (PgdA/CDA1 family)